MFYKPKENNNNKILAGSLNWFTTSSFCNKPGTCVLLTRRQNGQLAVENHHFNPYRTYMLELIDILVFYVPLKSISLIWRCDHYWWRAVNLGLSLYSALRAFEQRAILVVPHLLRHGISVFPVSSKGRTALINRLLRLAMACRGPILIRILTGPHSVASYDTHGGAEDIFLPGSLRVHTFLDNSF